LGERIGDVLFGFVDEIVFGFVCEIEFGLLFVLLEGSHAVFLSFYFDVAEMIVESLR
jgi:hypothetical protein